MTITKKITMARSIPRRKSRAKRPTKPRVKPRANRSTKRSKRSSKRTRRRAGSWAMAVKKAYSQLGLTGSKKFKKGSAFYNKAMAIHSRSRK